VEGALHAAKAFDVKVILVGREDVIGKELDKHARWHSLPIEIKHASEQITMEDSAGKAVRSKRTAPFVLLPGSSAMASLRESYQRVTLVP
jgi:glycerol-3-phosphate acyltransferase PlsX